MKNKYTEKTMLLIIFPSLVSLFTFLSACISVAPAPEPVQESVQEQEEITIDDSASVPETKPTATKREKYLSEKAISVIARTYAISDTPGGKVLAAAVEMVDDKVIIIGGCWGYVNAVYEKAGFPDQKRVNLYNADKTGPYLDPSIILPGDWIMYRNLPYKEIGHSAIFVEWIDFERRSALTIEYVGGRRNIPGRYREADITKTFGLYRGTE